jgi:hypothetical protein
MLFLSLPMQIMEQYACLKIHHNRIFCFPSELNAQHITNLHGGPVASKLHQTEQHCVGAAEVKTGRLEANNDTDYSGLSWALL